MLEDKIIKIYAHYKNLKACFKDIEQEIDNHLLQYPEGQLPEFRNPREIYMELKEFIAGWSPRNSKYLREHAEPLTDGD